jgi:hypothetical protein
MGDLIVFQVDPHSTEISCQHARINLPLLVVSPSIFLVSWIHVDLQARFERRLTVHLARVMD